MVPYGTGPFLGLGASRLEAFPFSREGGGLSGGRVLRVSICLRLRWVSPLIGILSLHGCEAGFANFLGLDFGYVIGCGLCPSGFSVFLGFGYLYCNILLQYNFGLWGLQYNFGWLLYCKFGLQYNGILQYKPFGCQFLFEDVADGGWTCFSEGFHEVVCDPELVAWVLWFHG